MTKCICMKDYGSSRKTHKCANLVCNKAEILIKPAFDCETNSIAINSPPPALKTLAISVAISVHHSQYHEVIDAI
jgi:hypothetical protein